MIVLVATAPIRGRVVSAVDTRLIAGDYMVSCEGKLSDCRACANVLS